MHSPRSRVDLLKHAVIATIAVAGVTALKLGLGHWAHGDADALYLAVVAFAVWRSDWRLGLFTVLLCGTAQAFFFMEPAGSLSLEDSSNVFGLVTWIIEGSSICFLVGMLNARRRHAVAASAASDRAYFLMFDASPVAMYVFDPKTLRFTRVNDAALALYGYSRDIFLSKRLVDLKPPSDHEALRTNLREDKDGDFRGAVKHLKEDGTPMAIEVVSRRLEIDGSEVRLCIVVDRTEHLKLESQLRQAQKMDAVGRLAGGVAHDFNNMLMIIMGCTWSAIEDTRDMPETQLALKEIMHAAERSGDLTRQLLAFSRQSPQHTKVVDLNETVTATQKLVHRLVGEDVEIVTQLANGGCPSEVDVGQVEQAIMNLAVNARDAMPNGGKLVIETSVVECDESFTTQHPGMKPGAYVMIAVSDDGIGMDAATASRIFEPFFTTKPPGKGTGLGLSIVFGVMRQHGGHVWVYSEPGLGTTFKLYFPLAKSAVVASIPKAIRALPRGHETILLVEDETSVMTLVASMLRRCGYEVLTASRPSEALVICAKHEKPIDMLITDVIMPEMNGRDLAERVIAMRTNLKVLYMSGYTDNVVLNHGLRSDTAFLQKPIMPDALARKVRAILGRARAA
jgi:hypothetical protein